MIVFLNGKFVPDAEATVSVFDRSFLYGDGLFETMLVARGVPFRWVQHIERFEHGASFLGISLPYELSKIREFAARLIRENNMPQCLMRLTLSRGVGIRGYSPRGAEAPTLVMSLHPAPVLSEGMIDWRLITAGSRLPAKEPLAQLKHCNKLIQILARAHADEAGCDEALLLNTDGAVVEGASSNLFWIAQGEVRTPPLASGILSGVTRSVVLELCRELKLPVRETNTTTDEIFNAEGVFLSLSSFGIVQGLSLDGRMLNKSPLTALLRKRYIETIHHETAGHDVQSQ